MHPNPAFRNETAAQNLDFARARGFGALCINGTDGPLIAHIPFELNADGSAMRFHLARSNAIVRADLPCLAVMVVMGPDGYISPDWYGTPDQVPTWNYIAVHMRGQIRPLKAGALEPHLNAVSNEFESRLAPKPIWRSSKMAEGVMARMMRAILPFEMQITGIDGTWKLGQNKTADARAGAIAGLRALGMMDLANHMEQKA
jgi:transcriptional regulator